MGIFDGLSARYQAWSDKRAAKKESKRRASLADAQPPMQPPGGPAAPSSSAASSAASQIAHPRQQQQVQPDEDEGWDDDSDRHHAAHAHHQHRHHALPSLGQHLQNQSSASIALAQGNALPPGYRDARSASMFHAASSAPPLVGHQSGSGGFRSSSPTSMPQHSQISTHGYQRQLYPHSGLGSSPSSDLGSMMRSSGGLPSLHTTPQRNNAASFGPASGGAGVGPAEHKEAGDHDLFSDELESGLPMGGRGAGASRQLFRHGLFGGQPSADAPAQTDDEKFAELLQQQEYLSFMEESGEISHADATALARSAEAQREKEARRAARRKAKDSERAARAAAAAAAAAGSGSSVSSSASSAAAAAPSAGGSESSLPPFPPLSLQLPASLPSSPVQVDSPSPTPSPGVEESGAAAAPSPAALRAFREFRARATQHQAQLEASSSSSAGAYRPHAMSVSSHSHASSHPHHHMQPHPVRTQSNVEERGEPPPFLHGVHSAHAHPQSSSNSPSRSMSYSHSMSSHHHPAGVHTPTSVSAASCSSPHHQPHNATLAHSSSTPVQRASSLSRAELNSLPTFLYVPSPSSVLAKKEAKEKAAAAAAAQKLEAERVAAVAAATALLAQVAVTETLVVDVPTAVVASEPLAAPKPPLPLSPTASTALVLEAVVVDCATTVVSPAPSEEEAASMDSCSICLDDYGREDKLRCLPCLHRYHAGCIDDWLSRSSVCPNCNVDVREAFN